MLYNTNPKIVFKNIFENGSVLEKDKWGFQYFQNGKHEDDPETFENQPFLQKDNVVFSVFKIVSTLTIQEDPKASIFIVFIF